MRRSTRQWSSGSWPRSRPELLSRPARAAVGDGSSGSGNSHHAGPAGDATYPPGQRRVRGRIVGSMTDDVLELAERLWRGDIGPSDYHPVSHGGGGLTEICDGVAFVPSFANVSAFATPDGLVLVDTASSFTAG